MALETSILNTPATTELRLSSGNGTVARTILNTPLRDADPSEVPIIDVSGILSASLPNRKAVAEQIRQAAMNNGFFYIANHGIPVDVTNKAYGACLDFFRQPAALKEPANTKNSQLNQHKVGWKPPSTQQINPHEDVDNRESFSWRYDPHYDPSIPAGTTIPAKVAEYLRVDPDGFPWSTTTPSLSSFQTSVIPCWQSILALGRALLRTFALSLNLDEHAFDAKFTHPDAAMALNYYPALSSPSNQQPPSSGGNVSIGSHTDFQLFTILWQDTTGGLEVLSRDGQWLRAKPTPGTFVVNFGDYMQRITNDKFLSTVHRVRNWSGGERVSMAFFFGFNLDESCGVLDTCLEEGEVKRYEEMSPPTSIPPRGVYVPSPTFFGPSSSITKGSFQPPVDIEAQINHSLFLAKSGVTGLVLLGSTGEAVHLTRAERSSLVSSVRKGLTKAGFENYPIMAGVLTNGIDETLEWLEDYAKAGAQWGLVLTPGYFGAAVSQEGIVEWYNVVADRSPIPILVYNYPGVTNGVQVLPETYRALAQHPRIVGCKMWAFPTSVWAWAGLTLGTGLMATSRTTCKSPLDPTIDHAKFQVYSGFGNQLGPIVRFGAAGVIDGMAAFYPKTVVRLMALIEQGDQTPETHSEIQRLQFAVSQGEEFVMRYGVLGIKEAVYRLTGFGTLEGGRLPIKGKLPEGTWEKAKGLFLGPIEKAEHAL
ncbi:hypothetical protein N0V88_008153 [Collariella sp. IMI 366227]|nr:hypothetical protein N0V88_008153 [Collariella sp. IMI 366227]